MHQSWNSQAHTCFESQDYACWSDFGSNKIVAGDHCVIRLRRSSRGPGMQESCITTSYLKSKGLGKDCALITMAVSQVVLNLFFFFFLFFGFVIGHVTPERLWRRAMVVWRMGYYSNRYFQTYHSPRWMMQTWSIVYPFRGKRWHSCENVNRRVSKSCARIYALH